MANNSTGLDDLMPIPDGVNPYKYFMHGIHAALIQLPPSMTTYIVRQSILCTLFAYVFVVAIANLVLTVKDCRRRGKPVFFWRLVARERGRYIVGNRQLLEPCLTLVTVPFLVAHVASEWRLVATDEYDTTITPLRLVPWTLLFLQLWIVGWASFQSYLITAREDQPVVRLLRPVVVNTLFLLLGGAIAASLVVGIGFGIHAGIETSEAHHRLDELLIPGADAWPDPPPAGTLEAIRAEWAFFVEEGKHARSTSQGTLATFAVAPFFTALVNLGCIALLLLVRRQIKDNVNNLQVLQLSSFTPVFPVRAETDDHVVEMGVPGAKSAESHDSGRDAPAGVAFSVTPATPQPETDQDVFASEEEEIGSSVSKGSVTASSPTTSKSAHAKKSVDASLSRSAVRRLAGQGGGLGAQARNLQLLHRAELDLFITGFSGCAMTVSFTVLATWIAIDLSEPPSSRSYAEIEIMLLLSSWIYVAIEAVALTAHLRLAWLYMHRESGTPPPYLNPSPFPSSIGSISRPGSTRLERDGDELDAADIRGGTNPTWLSPADARQAGSSDSEGDESEPVRSGQQSVSLPKADHHVIRINPL